MCFEMPGRSLDIAATAVPLPVFGWLEERTEAPGPTAES